jgi:hypothetical protein
MRRTQTWALAAAVLVAGAAGCSRAAQSADAAGTVAPQRARAQLLVENSNLADLHVFVVSSGGSPMRIGFVAGESTAHFTLDGSYATGNPVSIVAVPVAGMGAARSDPLAIFGGETVTFRVQPELGLSYATVRR